MIEVARPSFIARKAFLLVLLGACGGALPRETTATNGRADDPWLEGGERCAPGAVGTPDDATLHIETTETGTGKVVGDGETDRVHYVARLPDGTIVHDTRQEGVPVELVLGSTKVICGFERAVLGMRAGEQRRVTIPWRLGFGDSGKPPAVPPRTDLTLVVDLFLPADPDLERGSAPARPPTSRGGGGRVPGGH